tara:strand:+ start:55 stop:555 length:501 start_codon:yes stop_codon:yes gene_type:complete
MALTKLNFSGQGSIIGSLPSGAVIQTVEGTKTSNTTSTQSRSFIDMYNFSVSITPTFANSKFKIMLQSNHQMQYSTRYMFLTVFRDIDGTETDISGTTTGSNTTHSGAYIHYSNGINHMTSVSHYIDTPNTTSTIIYKPRIRVSHGYVWYGYTNMLSLIQVEEIKG